MRGPSVASFVVAVAVAVCGAAAAVPSDWQSVSLVGRVAAANAATFNASAFAPNLAGELAGTNWQPYVVITNVVLNRTSLSLAFAMIAAPANFTTFKSRVTSLSMIKLEAIGLVNISLTFPDPTTAAPPPGEGPSNLWIFGVIAGGFVVAAAGVSFAEYRARSARARRKARANPPEMNAGMLCDN